MAAPTIAAISRHVRRTGSRPHSFSSSATAPVGVRGNSPSRRGAARATWVGALAPSMRRASTAGQARTAAAVSAVRPSSAAAAGAQSERPAASSATGPHPDGSSRTTRLNAGDSRPVSVVASTGNRVPGDRDDADRERQQHGARVASAARPGRQQASGQRRERARGQQLQRCGDQSDERGDEARMGAERDERGVGGVDRAHMASTNQTPASQADRLRPAPHWSGPINLITG